jgi:tRNA A37 threonylcarbamoyladenosine dehydratase
MWGRRKEARQMLTQDEVKKRHMPAELREEQLSRCTLFFGDEGMQRLRESKIAVVGLGGVGSHTVHMLARSGVGFLRLIDFDQVSLSSLNRHACATLSDVGTPKATCLRRFCEKICPDPSYLVLEDVVQMYTAENGPRLLEGHKWDLVVDAIDDVPTKAALLSHCLEMGIRVISCMGAGGKSDITRLHISDLRTASRDPLASKLRQWLKRLNNSDDSYLDDMDKITVVYSSEKTVVKLADFTEEQKAEGVHMYGAVDGMRIRILPVLGTMPAVMGQTLAAMALCDLGNKSFSPVTGERIGRTVRHRMLQHLKRRELEITQKVETEAGIECKEDEDDDYHTGRIINGNWIGPVQVDKDDMEYLLEIWRNRCAVTGDRLGAVLELVRWDLTKPSSCQNLVLMGSKALQKFEKFGKDSIPADVQKEIEKRLQSCRLDTYC